MEYAVKNGYLIFDEKNPKPYESILSKGIRKLMLGNGRVFKFPNDTLIENYKNYWNMRSVTKSIISLLIGIAINEGFLNSIDDKIEDFFKDYSGMSNDYRKKDITIKHLLTMKSGLGTIDKRASSIKFLKSKF
jgi:CubicO group peptidase (beta-lactamase class C family)